jgi:hypothetical protein
VSDHETSVLGSRLTDLADELAPSIDVMGQVEGARIRYRRNRRARIAVLSAAAAVAVAAVGVPTAVGSLAGPSSGEVARSAPATTTAPSAEEEAARSAAEEARDAAVASYHAADDRLDTAEADLQNARSQVVDDALADRDPPLELRAGTDRDCPDEAERLTEILGTEVRTEGGVDLVGGCRWSADGLTLQLSLVPGQTEEEMVREVDRSVSLDGCYVRAVPSVVDVTPLTLCPAAAGTTWTLRVPDSTGAGYWVLSAEEGAGAGPDAGAGGVLALVDVAAARW